MAAGACFTFYTVPYDENLIVKPCGTLSGLKIDYSFLPCSSSTLDSLLFVYFFKKKTMNTFIKCSAEGQKAN
jgi:hypothetical protein